MSNLKLTSIPEEKKVDGTLFPLTIAPNENIITTEDTVEFIKNNLEEINLKLLEHGVVLFRGFPLNSAKDFNDFALAFGWKDLPYIGGAAVRTNIYGVVFTSNESPPDQPIPFHHEMAQVPKFPSYLFFYCDVKPKEGGETPLCLSNSVYERVKRENPDFVKKLQEKGVIYTRVLPEEDDFSSPIGRGWKSTYLTDDKRVAEKKCIEHGGSFEWLENGCLKVVSKVLPAIRLDDRTGKLTWFNSIVAVYYGWRDSRNKPEESIKYGDNTPIDSKDIEKASLILDELSVAFKWEHRDVVLG